MLLPDLDGSVDVEIRHNNLRAVQAIYFAYALEELRVYQVVERIAELFRQGLLPLGRARADALMQYTRGGVRITEGERRVLYKRVLGVPGGSRDDVAANRDFLSLWLRFIVAVSSYTREHGRARIAWPPSAANARVRKSARALVVNLSAHAGILIEAATERLVEQERQLFAILADAEVQRVFGARDRWHVIDIVGRELGGARNVARYRAQAEAGSRILQWLGDHAGALRDDAGLAGVAAEGDSADLIDAAELWLAASGLQDDAIESYSTPIESPTMSEPVDLPAIAQELLAAVGVEAPAGRPQATLLLQGARRTGKTLAAHALAQELSADVWRIDLAALTSKTIGETEKNLERLFDAAEKAGAVLLFDEADALFGTRTDAKDAQDRYANLDAAALLQRIEDYDGIAILTTNLTHDLDAALPAEPRSRPCRVVRFPLVKRRR
jgi:hypothetical protein